jgi:hypothetical protein
MTLIARHNLWTKMVGFGLRDPAAGFNSERYSSRDGQADETEICHWWSFRAARTIMKTRSDVVP